MSFLTAPTLAHYLVLGAVLFAISIAGIFLNRKNVLILLMAIELMLLAVNLNFVAFSAHLGDMAGQVFVFFILTVAAAESAIGLAILVLLFRNVGSINVDDEGNPVGKTMLVENGILTTYLHDSISAKHFKVKPTGTATFDPSSIEVNGSTVRNLPAGDVETELERLAASNKLK